MARRLNRDQIAGRLHSAAIHLLRRVRVHDAAGGMGPARLSALSVVVFGGPISLQGLAQAEQVRPPTMSRVVDGLEAGGLVRRRVNAHDRRAVQIEATTKGIMLLKQGRRRRVRFLSAQLAKLNGAELAELDRSLRALEKVLAS